MSSGLRVTVGAPSAAWVVGLFRADVEGTPRDASGYHELAGTRHHRVSQAAPRPPLGRPVDHRPWRTHVDAGCHCPPAWRPAPPGQARDRAGHGRRPYAACLRDLVGGTTSTR